MQPAMTFDNSYLPAAVATGPPGPRPAPEPATAAQGGVAIGAAATRSATSFAMPAMRARDASGSAR